MMMMTPMMLTAVAGDSCEKISSRFFCYRLLGGVAISLGPRISNRVTHTASSWWGRGYSGSGRRRCGDEDRLKNYSGVPCSCRLLIVNLQLCVESVINGLIGAFSMHCHGGVLNARYKLKAHGGFFCCCPRTFRFVFVTRFGRRQASLTRSDLSSVSSDPEGNSAFHYLGLNLPRVTPSR